MRRATVSVRDQATVEMPLPGPPLIDGVHTVVTTLNNTGAAYALAKHWNLYLDMLQAAAHARTP